MLNPAELGESVVDITLLGLPDGTLLGRAVGLPDCGAVGAWVGLVVGTTLTGASVRAVPQFLKQHQFADMLVPTAQ